MKRIRTFLREERAAAVVEATILFPIMIMVFAGMVLLAMYLPQRATLQRAAQYAAVLAATTTSDTGFSFDTTTLQAQVQYEGLPNVYKELVGKLSANVRTDYEHLVESLAEEGMVSRNSTIEVRCVPMNYIVYKEIQVTATEVVKMPVDLSFVGMSDTLVLTATARCVVQNCDEFVRNVDIAADLTSFLDKKLGASDKLFKALDRIKGLFGI